MKHLLTLFAFLLVFNLTAQVKQTSSITYVSTGQDTAYILDSTIYNDGSVLVKTYPTQDSADLAQTVVNDTTLTDKRYTNAVNSYNSRAAALQRIQALKTPDSLRKEYYDQRKTEMKAVLDSIIAN